MASRPASPARRVRRRPATAALLTAAAWAACTLDQSESGRDDGQAQAGPAALAPGPQAAPGGAQDTDDEVSAFARMVWLPTLSQDCIACHISGGYAQSAGAKFGLWHASQPGYLAHNLASFRTFSAQDGNGPSYLEKKVTNAIPHGGGQRLTASDPRLAAITNFATTQAFLGTGLEVTAADLAQVTIIDEASTLARAAEQLAQRRPLPEESALVKAGNLDGALDSIMADANFPAFLSRGFEDIFQGAQWAVNYISSDRMDGTFFSQNERYWWLVPPFSVPSVNSSLAGYTQASIAMQPHNLAIHLIQNDLPFTQILTADYFMANPHGARAYGVFDAVNWSDPNNGAEYHPIAASHVAPAGSVAFPTAGVLTTETFLNTYTTTGSNRNRKRARMVYKLFLGLDVMGLAQSPPNLAAIIAGSDPAKPATLTNTACLSCHSMLDPVAGNFAKYSNYGAFNEDPNGWYGPAAMAAPGFQGALTPPEVDDSRLTWLAGEVTQDPRFAPAMVTYWLNALTQATPLTDPTDPNALPEQIAAKTYQEQFIAESAAQFVASGYSAKSLIKAVIKSPYYRAADAAPTLTASQKTMLGPLDTFHWRGAAELSAALRARVGMPWITDRVYDDTLTEAYSVLMSGNDPTGFGARVTSMMGTNMACYTFYAQRYGFLSADPNLLPDLILSGACDPTNAQEGAAVQAAIASLVGITSSLDPATQAVEAGEAFTLFENVFTAAVQAPDAVPTDCIGGRLTADQVAGRMAWMSVIAYLLTDPDLLFR